jgi:hypothetical protein
MSHSNDQALDPVAAFLANGGKIQEVDEGVRTSTEREIYAKASGRDHLAERYTDRSMRDAENQVGLEQYHSYYRH